MELVPDTGQRLFIYSAEPDSPSDAALRLLAGLTAENAAKAESGKTPHSTRPPASTGSAHTRYRMAGCAARIT